MRTLPAAARHRRAPTRSPTLAVTPSTRKLNTVTPTPQLVTHSPNAACVVAPSPRLRWRRPRSAIWTASARGITAFIAAADAERRRSAGVDVCSRWSERAVEETRGIAAAPVGGAPRRVCGAAMPGFSRCALNAAASRNAREAPGSTHTPVASVDRATRARRPSMLATRPPGAEAPRGASSRRASSSRLAVPQGPSSSRGAETESSLVASLGGLAVVGAKMAPSSLHAQHAARTRSSRHAGARYAARIREERARSAGAAAFKTSGARPASHIVGATTTTTEGGNANAGTAVDAAGPSTPHRARTRDRAGAPYTPSVISPAASRKRSEAGGARASTAPSGAARARDVSSSSVVVANAASVVGFGAVGATATSRAAVSAASASGAARNHHHPPRRSASATAFARARRLYATQAADAHHSPGRGVRGVAAPR
eukprot:1960-Pelagococcus_subviridis.AAC.1